MCYLLTDIRHVYREKPAVWPVFSVRKYADILKDFRSEQWEVWHLAGNYVIMNYRKD